MEKRTYRTDRELQALKPSDRWYDVKDSHTRNLIVRVGPMTSRGKFKRTFCLVTRFPGNKNPVRHAFGEYGSDLSLEDARVLADEWRKQIRKGIDPREVERQREEEAARQKQESEKRDKLAFGIVVEDFLKRHVSDQRRAAQVEREIRRELIPHWKDKLITEITPADVVELTEAIADRPAPAQARNVYGHVSAFFNWCIGRAVYGLESSPCDRLKPSKIIGEKKPRQRVLTDDELFALWRAAGRLGYPYGPLFRVLALTGQRKSEVAEARWREFDLPGKIWTVPPERFKSDASHLVPLTDDVIEILNSLPRFIGPHSGEHLFSTTIGAKPVNGFSKAKERLDREMLQVLQAMARKKGDDPSKVQLAEFVIHDIRRTVRTRLSALKVQSEVAELVIGHAKKGLERVYNQYEFADEMREALEKWAAKLNTIVSPPPDNVVSISEARM